MSCRFFVTFAGRVVSSQRSVSVRRVISTVAPRCVRLFSTASATARLTSSPTRRITAARAAVIAAVAGVNEDRSPVRLPAAIYDVSGAGDGGAASVGLWGIRVSATPTSAVPTSSVAKVSTGRMCDAKLRKKGDFSAKKPTSSLQSMSDTVWACPKHTKLTHDYAFVDVSKSAIHPLYMYPVLQIVSNWAKASTVSTGLSTVFFADFALTNRV